MDSILGFIAFRHRFDSQRAYVAVVGLEHSPLKHFEIATGLGKQSIQTNKVTIVANFSLNYISCTLKTH